MRALPYLLPALLVFALFEYYPLLRVIYLSLTDADLLKSPQWIGLANYTRMFQSAEFLNSLAVTVIFAFAVTGLEVVLGMTLGFLMNRKGPFQNLVRGAVFAPVVVSLAAAAVIWLHLLNPTGGPVNQLLQALGLPPSRWLQDPGTALAAVILIALWKGVGLPAVLYLAGLQGIPKELQEAAQVDGATPYQVARWITLPLLGPHHPAGVFHLAGGHLPELRPHPGAPHRRRPGGQHHVAGLLHLPERFPVLPDGLCQRSVGVSVLAAGLLGWLQFKVSERRVHYQ